VDNIALNNEHEDFEILKDIEQQTDENIRKLRSHDRLTVKAKLILQSANSSELLSYKVQGIMGDVSKGGCRAMLPIPINVGDVYRLRFDRQGFDISLIFARCLRCRLVREDAYEAGFTFFTPIDLAAFSISQATADSLI
jgi:hypothetical protein